MAQGRMYKCPHCQKPIPEDEILRAASHIMDEAMLLRESKETKHGEKARRKPSVRRNSKGK